MTSIKRSGAPAVALTYGGAGRLQSIASADATYTYGYHATAGTLTTITAAGGASLNYTYDGSLPTGVTWSGGITGAVAYAWDSKFRLTQETAGGAAIAFGYDADDLLTSAGALTLTRDAQSGFVTGTTLGNVADSFAYNASGEVMSYTATYAGNPLLAFTYERDTTGRITSVTTAGVKHGYEYDPAGRLARGTSDGAIVAEYDYDANSNRTEHRYLGGSDTATYDGQDRLLTYGNTTYEYTASGELRTKTVAGSTTTFTHDALGNLRTVTVPGGTTIEYVIDGQNRRVGKKVNGTLVQGWLYSDQLRIAAEMDGSGAVVSRFVYGSRTNSAVC